MADKAITIIADGWDEEIGDFSETPSTADDPYFLGIEEPANGMAKASSTGEGIMDRLRCLYELMTENNLEAPEVGPESDLAHPGARSDGTWKP